MIFAFAGMTYAGCFATVPLKVKFLVNPAVYIKIRYMRKFEFIEHTADIGVRVYGKTLDDLFANAAGALFTILVETKPRSDFSRNIILEGETFEDLLVNWLNELISAFFAEKFLPCRYDLSVTQEHDRKVLKARLTGQEFDPYDNKINREIKAATYHNLKIEYEKFYKAEIIFDV